jgi:mono/diheme cytochrome c family protein
VNIDGQSWALPSEAQCLACHTAAAGRSLGLEIAQLNGNLLYPQTGRTANQVVTLNAVQMFDPPESRAPSAMPALPDPYGGSGSLAERARAYLHTNCAQCHRPGGGTPTNLDLRYTTALGGTNACNATPQAGDFGIANARIIAVGDASRSVLLARMDRRDALAMPPLASKVVDTAGVSLVRNWITSLASCD